MTGGNVVLTCCRDEEDIIEAFIRFYLEQGFDAIHVVDNGSSDRTADIVEALIAAGLPVGLTRDPRVGYERFLTEWFHDAGRRYQPDWLFFLDCDEFVLFPGGARAWLGGVPPPVRRLTLRQREFYPPDDGSHFLLSRRTEPHFNDTTKDVVRYDSRARVYGGKHRIDVEAAGAMCPLEIFIRHYKYRSAAQAARKEQTRVAVKRTYSDADLERISSNGLEPARAWRDWCEEAAAAEEWRDSFAPADWIEDGGMAEWAGPFVQRLSAAQGSVR